MDQIYVRGTNSSQILIGTIDWGEGVLFLGGYPTKPTS